MGLLSFIREKTGYDVVESSEALETKAIVGTDYLGRTNPVSSFTVANNTPVNWIGLDKAPVSSVVYTIINAIQVTASSIPVGVYSLNKDRTADLLPAHPLTDLLYRPNPTQSFSSFLKQALKVYLTKGNLFIWIVKAGNKPTQLYILPNNVEVLATNQIIKIVTGYRIALATGGYQTFEADDIIHIKNSDDANDLLGESALTACIKELTAHSEAMNQRVKQVQNGGTKSVIYEDDSNSAEGSLTDEQQESFTNKLKRQESFTYSTIKLGKIDIGLSPVELEILDSLKADAATIAGVFNYPSQLLPNSEGNTFSNVAEAQKAYYTNCVIPLLKTISDGLNLKLGKYYSDKAYIDFDLSQIEVLKPNLSALITAAATADFLTVNEKRLMVGAKALETGGDGFLLPINISYKATIDAKDILPEVDVYAAGDVTDEG